MTPQTTPREVLYIETGLLDPETISNKQRIMISNRLKKEPNMSLKNYSKPKDDQ